MVTTYYKATRTTGTDFYSGTVDYAAALTSGERLVAAGWLGREQATCCTRTVLHASDVPTETLIGGSWPCRLFEVTGRPVAHDAHKHGFRSLRVVREVEAWQALGPQGQEVATLVDRARELTADEAKSLYAAGDAARYAARDAVRYASWYAARYAAGYAAGDAARYAAGDAARALVVRDLIGDTFTHEHYDTLTRPWRTVIGPIHPDDEALP